MVPCWHTRLKMKVGLIPILHSPIPIPLSLSLCVGIICAESLVGGVGHLDYNCVPSVVYTHPVREKPSLVAPSLPVSCLTGSGVGGEE